MEFVSQNGTKREYKTQFHIVRRSISFFLPSPATWTEELFLDIVWEVCGDNCAHVVLRDVYHAPNTLNVSHNYDVFFRIGNKMLQKEQVNELMAQIEDRCRELNFDLRGSSHRKVG